MVAWRNDQVIGLMSKETQHTLRQGLARVEREAGLSPVTEVIGAVHQDDHAVHCDDPDDQQAEGTDLEGRERWDG